MSSPDAVERSGLKQSQSQVNENVSRNQNFNQRKKASTENLNNYGESEANSVELQETLDNYGSPLNEYGSQQEANNQQESIQTYKATEISAITSKIIIVIVY